MVSVQSNMQMHDELAALFSRTLTLNPELQAQPELEPQQVEQPIYSASQHYTQSAHMVRALSEPSTSETAAIENILRMHGVDPSALTPSQVQLFKAAETPQKMRLLELWSICPPGQGSEIPSLAWSSTVEQEEYMAQIRYERLSQQQTMSLDGTPIQTADGRWTQQHEVESEPYMLSGYEELMQREHDRQAQDSQPRTVYNHFGTAVGASNYSPATDPVYMGSDAIRQQQQQQQMDMATQYGSYQQFRGAEVMDCM